MKRSTGDTDVGAMNEFEIVNLYAKALHVRALLWRACKRCERKEIN